MSFVFADCETTGLDAFNDELVEVSYAVDEDYIRTLFFGVKEVPPHIDELIKFTERGVAVMPESDQEDLEKFRERLKGNTLVAANPSFDRDFLAVHGLWTGHYRMLDIESYAMGKLDLDYVPGMKQIYEILTERGYKLTAPDHTSRRDVACLREAFRILRYQF